MFAAEGMEKMEEEIEGARDSGLSWGLWPVCVMPSHRIKPPTRWHVRKRKHNSKMITCILFYPRILTI